MKESSLNGYESQQFFEVIGAPAGLLAFDVDARLAGALLLDEVQCDATQDCKVLGAGAEGHVDCMKDPSLNVL